MKSFNCLFDAFFLKVLKFVYKFDNWHSLSSVNCRRYKSQLISKINLLSQMENLVTVVEIGCGLGDLLSNINANNKYGFDIDYGVIKASKFLHKDIIFLNGSFVETCEIPENQIDLLILVNWTHNLSLEEISNEVNHILISKQVNFILVDEVLVNTFGYKFFHNFSDAFNGFETYDLFLDIEGIRNFRILRNIANA